MTVTKCVFEYIPRFAKAKIQRWACVINFWPDWRFPWHVGVCPSAKFYFDFLWHKVKDILLNIVKVNMSKNCLRCLNNSFFEDVPYLQKGTPPTCGRECLCSREPRTWPWLVDDLHIVACGGLPLVCPCSRTAAASYTSSSSTPQW